MKKTIIISAISALILCGIFSSCKKSFNEVHDIYVPVIPPANPIDASKPMAGSYKGTMLSGKTYNIIGDVTINAGDTLWLQPGVTVCISNASTIYVKGVLISLGTQAAPNWFTICGKAKVNTIAQAESPSTDPAWSGDLWHGIQCDTTCTLLVLKWTHVEFAGAASTKSILFQRIDGDFIMEDSWLYGGTDDPIRITCGHISIMRNTFEKGGYVGGDCINMKNGTVGDVAYNLFIGTATTGSKASDKGTASPTIHCKVNMYNNTYINGGYRQSQTGRGANVNYEQGASGMAYNNLIVNCKFGLRIVGNPTPADTTNTFYGYNYIYGDSASVCNQFFPQGYITKPNAYIVPSIGTIASYIYDPVNGAPAYDASFLVGKNNPLFINFLLPEQNFVHLYDINNAEGFNFRLQANSPALGIGYTAFSPLNAITPAVANDPIFGTNVTPPGVDMGCYQINGTGNQH